LNLTATTTGTTTVEGCSFVGNTGFNVGGLYFNAGTYTVKNSIFRDNKNTDTANGSTDASALYSSVSTTTVQNSVFANNSSLANTNKNHTVKFASGGNCYNCTFANNNEPGSTGYTFTFNAAVGTIKNCVFWNNTNQANFSGVGNNGISNYNATTTGLNTNGLTNSNNITTLTLSPNNTFVSPTSFTGAPSTSDGGVQKAASAAANWSMLIGSPAVDTGTDLTTSGITTDILGNLRPLGAVYDMGAYERNSLSPATRYLVQGTTGTNTWRAAGVGEVIVTTNDFKTWYTTTFPSGYTYNAVDEIWLAGGTYILSNFIGQRKVNLYGGFAGTETTIAGRSKVSGGKAWEFTTPTILDGNNAIPQGFNCSGIATTPNTYIDGVKITKCQVTNVTASIYGVGAYITQGCVMQNCIVSNNTYNNTAATNAFDGNGGGIYLTGGQVLNSYISNNQLIKGNGRNTIGGGVAFAYTSEAALNTVSGCTIENNTCTTYGGGIEIINGTGGTIENCIIKGNSSSDRGSGLGYTNTASGGTSTLSIKNCQFIENTGATYGGGVALNSATTATIIFENNSIIGNTGVNAGGMYIGGGTYSAIKNCIFRDNKCTNDGNSGFSAGALFCNVAGVSFQNCVFANNSSVANTNTNSTVELVQSTIKMYNCTFANNSDPGAAGSTINAYSGMPTLKNNVFWGNAAVANLGYTTNNAISNYNATTSDKTTTGSVGGGTIGNITTLTTSPNNTFASPTSFAGVSTDATTKSQVAAADWSMIVSSPAVNTGTDLGASGVTTDILGNPRPTGANAVDMGAYESAFTAQVITFGALSVKTYGAATSTLSATGGASANPVTFTSSNTAVATCTGTNGTTLTVVGAGSCIIYANQASSTPYSAASPVAQTLTVNAKTLTLTTPAATSKVYNGTNTAVVSGTLSGIINSDAVTCTTGTFTSVNVGSSIAVTCVLSGAKATNYTLSQPGITANITAKALTIGAASIASKTYNASATSGTVTVGTLSGFVGSETVTVSTATGLYPDANVANGKTATITYTLANGTLGGLAANYSLANGSATGDITTATLTVDTPAVTTKVYTSTNTAVITGTLTGILNSDDVTLTGIGTFADVNVAEGIAVISTSTLGGLKAGNYTLTQPIGLTGNITAKALTIGAASIASKVSDGNATSGTVTSGTLSGFVSPETVTVNTAVGTYSDAIVENGKTATIVYTLSNGDNGGLATNYSLANGSAIGDITSATINIVGTKTAADLTSSSADVTISGTSTVLTMDNSRIVKSLALSDGAEIKLSGSNTLTVNGNLDLKADLTTSFSLNLGSSSVIVPTGTVRYIKTIDDQKWYFISFPCEIAISGIRKADGSSMGVLGSNWFIKYYDGSRRASQGTTNGVNWFGLSSVDYTIEPITFKLNANQGYIIGIEGNTHATVDIAFPINKNYLANETDLARTKVPVTVFTGSKSNDNGWNLIGQPYLSKFKGSDADVNYMLFSDGTSSYTTCSAFDGTLAAKIIDPFTAYFVQAGSSNVSFTITGRQGIKSVVAQSLAQLVQLNMTTQTGTDYTSLILDDAQTTAYQIGQDMEKWIGTGTAKPQVYTVLDGINYAFNALPLSSVRKKTPYFFQQSY